MLYLYTLRLSFCMQNEERFGAAPPEIIQFDHAWKLLLAEGALVRKTRASAIHYFLPSFLSCLAVFSCTGNRRSRIFIISSVLIKNN